MDLSINYRRVKVGCVSIQPLQTFLIFFSVNCVLTFLKYIFANTSIKPASMTTASITVCTQVYPHLDVWNVVEASEKVTIGNWCNFAHNNCHHRFKVRPFRCLGNSDSNSHDNVYDAVIVAVHCHCESSPGSSDECSTQRQVAAHLCWVSTGLLLHVEHLGIE